MNKNLTKNIISVIVAMIIGVAVMSFYFYPELQDKIVAGGDVVSSTAWSKQNQDYLKRTGETSNWNPSMFGGMPWGLLSLGTYDNYVRVVDKASRLFVSKHVLSLGIKLFVMAFIALMLLGVNVWLSMILSLAFSLNVNFMVLLEAGHQSKVNVLANFPLILSGLILCLRANYVRGMLAIAVGASLAMLGNHIQMVYYLLLAFVCLAVVLIVFAIINKEMSSLIKAFSFALIAALIAAGSNFGQLASSKSFAKDTMRAAPILKKTAGPNDISSDDGLKWDYAMQWSNELKDLYSFFVPRAVGGSSYEEVDANSEIGRLLRQNNAQLGSDRTYQAPMYWGGLPFTSGPYYSGMAMLFFCFLSFFIVKSPVKWGMLASIIFILITSMGKNGILNGFLFENLPLYSSFRSPNSAVNVIPVFLLMLSALGLQEIFATKDLKRLTKPFLYASGTTLGLLLLIWVGGMGFSFSGANDGSYPPEIAKIFQEGRKSMFNADVVRSLMVFALAFLIVGSYVRSIVRNKAIVLALLGIVVIGDLYLVSKRHLDEDNFESKDRYATKFDLRPADSQILQQETRGRGYYRVLDLAINTFNSPITSYHHNTIGGYSAIKLQRFDDIITYYLRSNTPSVLNMLNAKYIVDQNKQLQVNSDAYGEAWFVKSIKTVNTANEEIEALGGMDTRNEAVVLQSEFADQFQGPVTRDGQGSIELTSYELNEMTYSSNSATPQTAIFSEVYYKGWEATVNGEPADIFRANYILRGMHLPAGQNTIVFKYKPRAPGAIISVVFSLLILAGLAYGLFLFFTNLKSKYTEEEVVSNQIVDKGAAKVKESKPVLKKRVSKKKKGKNKKGKNSEDK